MVLLIFFFLIGLFLGSFFNVVILRVPKKESIVYPASHCPKCGNKLKWYMNIPLFSYIFLKGRCAYCNAKISSQYPFVEVFTGLGFAFSFYLYGFSLTTLDFIFFFSALFISSVIDINEMILPPEILILPFLWRIFFNIKKDIILINSISFAIFFIFMWLIAFIGKKLYKKEALGGGDIYYSAFIAFFIGWKRMIPALFLAFIVASLTGFIIALIKRKSVRDTVIPLGPFLSLGGIFAYIWGENVISWYLTFFRG